MKKYIQLLFSLGIVFISNGHVSAQMDSCIFNGDISVRAYIKGERDTVINNTNQKSLRLQFLKNGLNVLLTDTTYKIISYSVEFVIDDPVLIVSAPSNGPILTLPLEYDNYLKKLKPMDLFGLSKIRVYKNNRCFLIRAALYVLTE